MLGAAYVGESRGMRGGTIIVEGQAGSRAGERMRRGMILIQGATGEYTGVNMIAGSIFVLGTLGPKAGAGMKRGSIVAMGGMTGDMLAVFRYACVYSPSFLRYYLKQIQDLGLDIDPDFYEKPVRRYTGDITSLGKGEILFYDQPE
jgi:formylmethanofuran dehydrogenase subunit C